ncbi:hypothetical protein ES703_67299 [subsurface metagenome]
MESINTRIVQFLSIYIKVDTVAMTVFQGIQGIGKYLGCIRGRYYRLVTVGFYDAQLGQTVCDRNGSRFT